jgi:aminobenzoyl-glutamate transport protein
MVLGAPRHVVTVAVVFAGIVSNTASEVGYVVLIPLAGAIFYALGRHPLAGMAAAFAGVSGGYSANLLIGTVDPLLAGITEEAAQLVDPAYTVNATANWFFMIASTFLITIVGSLVSIFVVEPKLGAYKPERADPTILNKSMMESPGRAGEERPRRCGPRLPGRTGGHGLHAAARCSLSSLDALAGRRVGPGDSARLGGVARPDTGSVMRSPFFPASSSGS